MFVMQSFYRLFFRIEKRPPPHSGCQGLGNRLDRHPAKSGLKTNGTGWGIAHINRAVCRRARYAGLSNLPADWSIGSL